MNKTEQIIALHEISAKTKKLTDSIQAYAKTFPKEPFNIRKLNEININNIDDYIQAIIKSETYRPLFEKGQMVYDILILEERDKQCEYVVYENGRIESYTEDELLKYSDLKKQKGQT